MARKAIGYMPTTRTLKGLSATTIINAKTITELGVTGRTYTWRIAVMIAGAKSKRTGIKHVAISTVTDEPYGADPYKIIALPRPR